MPRSSGKQSHRAGAPARQIALIRGINVGRAKRLSMHDLRELLEALGAGNVRTVLNSGNAIYDPPPRGLTAETVAEALERRTGVRASVVLIDGPALEKIAAANPLAEDAAANPARLLIGFYTGPGVPKKLAELARRDWSPEALVVRRDAAYLWCANGIAAGRLMLEADRAAGGQITCRNWSTVQRILAIAAGASTSPARGSNRGRLG